MNQMTIGHDSLFREAQSTQRNSMRRMTVEGDMLCRLVLHS